MTVAQRVSIKPFKDLNENALNTFMGRLRRHSRLELEDEAVLLALPVQSAELRAYTDLAKLGAQTRHAYLVVEGIVGRFIQSKDGSRQIISTYLPGEVAGLHNVVLPRADADLQTLGQARVLCIPLSSLRQAVARSLALAEALWREFTIEAARIAASVVNVSRRPAQSRIAYLLCEMAWRYNGRVPGPHFRFEFAVTQATMGDILGLTSVHVNRMVRSLAKDRIVEMDRGIVHICDWRTLSVLGEFDPAYLGF